MCQVLSSVAKVLFTNIAIDIDLDPQIIDILTPIIYVIRYLFNWKPIIFEKIWELFQDTSDIRIFKKCINYNEIHDINFH